MKQTADRERLKRLCVMGMLCALAYVAVALIRVPVVAFLKYEPKDVFLVIGAFLYGPLPGLAMTAAVSLVEMVTVSDTGLIGLVMNILSSGLFVVTASAVYQRRRTLPRAVIGLVAGAVAMTAGMLLWNYLITPLYMAVDRAAVAGMLLTVFLPFNLLKAGLNAALAVILYKSVAAALRAARLLPPADTHPRSRRDLIRLAALFLLITLIVLLLIWKGIL